VRGVVVLSKLGVVRIWWQPDQQRILLSPPWWSPRERGQALTEYALAFAFMGVLLSALWSLISLLGIEQLRDAVLEALFPGSLGLFGL
jgi:hypothetical protein